MKKIVTERTLYIDNAVLSEGSEAYILFRKDKETIWVFGKVYKLTDETVTIYPANGFPCHAVILTPCDIVKVTDNDVPDEITDRLLKGEYVLFEKEKNNGTRKKNV